MTQTLPVVAVCLLILGAIAFIVGMLRKRAHQTPQSSIDKYEMIDMNIENLKSGDIMVPHGTSYIKIPSPYYSGRQDINPEFAQTTGVTDDDLTEFEDTTGFIKDEPIEDPRIVELFGKIGAYQKQLRYWKGDVLKEAEYTGLINECLRNIDKIRKENDNG
jgi:hypothetical protein